MMRLASLAIERLEEAVVNDEIKPEQLSVPAAIMVDKSLLLSGEATARVTGHDGTGVATIFRILVETAP